LKIKQLNKSLFLLILLPFVLSFTQDKSKEIILNPNEQGFIPAWLVSGPFEFPLVGFGNSKDTIAIGEPDISPFEGGYATSNQQDKEKLPWFLQSINKKGFVDFNKTIQWDVNTSVPIKIWFTRVGYAFTTIESETDKDILLTLGSNSQVKVFLNEEKVYSSDNLRNAVKDQDTLRIKLKKGRNDLIVKVFNTHKNNGISYFGVINWEWGFYARLLEKDGTPVSDVKYIIKSEKNKTDFNVASTFFYKKIEGQLKQRIDVEINSKNPQLKIISFSFYNCVH